MNHFRDILHLITSLFKLVKKDRLVEIGHFLVRYTFPEFPENFKPRILSKVSKFPENWSHYLKINSWSMVYINLILHIACIPIAGPMLRVSADFFLTDTLPMPAKFVPAKYYPAKYMLQKYEFYILFLYPSKKRRKR